ncbi:hypothetical protein Z945_2418 [Sulfitobacter noctilucae]|uniref:hypothetical protein n=1 Tax=Sulfitobacter noctilucae TaxID=1342302 RepID=UPI000469CDF9|nr:hypothetical protein [Sulfitobacter noctilucae]KIN61426.1 hypothetical protein Z945_2418 [Sulfitobacter noctilucae]
MPRWLWWMPLVVLTVVAGLLAYRQGYVAAQITETDVINHYAAIYVAEGPEGARVTDCAAVPGQEEGVWLVVNCGGAAHIVQYRVDRFGRLIEGDALEGPQT